MHNYFKKRQPNASESFRTFDNINGFVDNNYGTMKLNKGPKCQPERLYLPLNKSISVDF